MSSKIREIGGGQAAFWCPGCQGAHVFDQRWERSGNEESPTISPSLLVQGYCGDANTAPGARCHLFIRNGSIEFLQDCTHTLAGQRVPMVEDWA